MREARHLLAAAVASAAAAGLIACGDDGEDKPIPLADSKTAAERVEKVRGLRFRRPPRIKTLDDAGLEYTLRRVTNEELLRQNSAGRLDKVERQAAASQQLLLLTGILDPKSDPQKVREAGGGLIAGAYVPKQNTVFLRAKAVGRGGRAGNAVQAHELTHALEEQALGSRPTFAEPLAESTAGGKALSEGSATFAEILYARRYLGVTRSPQEIFERRERAIRRRGLPPVLAASAVFPYVQGGRFAEALYGRGGDSWRLVDEAHRRPPVSTEQVLHPEKWVARERPVRVSTPTRLPAGQKLRLVGGGELGEFDTRLLLGEGVGRRDAERAAAGWGGGAFSVWRKSGPPDPLCAPPCRKAGAALMAWEWDSERDAGEAWRAIQGLVQGALKARSAGDGAWQLEDGAVAVAGTGKRSSLAFAANVRAAKALAAAGAR